MADSWQRLLLTLAFVALFALCLWAMARSWRRRGARDAELLPLPDLPQGVATVEGDVPGLYLGTVHAGRWTDRVVAGGLSRRAAGALEVTASGIVVRREDDTPLFIPRAAVTDAYLSPGLAGSVVGERGVLVVAWQHNGVDLESGFRADDPTDQVRVAEDVDTWTAERGGHP